MSNYTLEAQTALSHTGQSLGTISYLRREKFLTPQGVTEIPIISGNSIRGALRDKAANQYTQWLGNPYLPLPVNQLLFSGGAITKAKGDPLSGEELRKVREACPPLALFGGSIAGRVLSGRVSVGRMIPICKETLRYLPHDTKLPDEVPELWDITTVAEYSRFPDADESSENGGTMRYGIEQFVPGTAFSWWVETTTYNKAESSLIALLISQILTGKTLIGGKKGQGYGRVTSVGNPVDNTPPSHEWEDSMPVSPEEATTLLIKYIR